MSDDLNDYRFVFCESCCVLRLLMFFKVFEMFEVSAFLCIAWFSKFLILLDA